MIGNRGFWDCSCRKTLCGASVGINKFTPTLGCYTVHKRCEPVLGGISLFAEVSGCTLLFGSLKKWVDKCVSGHYPFLRFSFPLCTLQFSLACSAQELIVTEPHTPAPICGCLVARGCGTLRYGLCEAEGQVFSFLAISQHAFSSTTDRAVSAGSGWSKCCEDLCGKRSGPF